MKITIVLNLGKNIIKPTPNENNMSLDTPGSSLVYQPKYNGQMRPMKNKSGGC